jgi:hypothetical protein
VYRGNAALRALPRDMRELSGSLDTRPGHNKQCLTTDQAGNMNIDAIAALGGAYWHALIAVATVRKQPFIYDSYQMIWTVCKSFAIEAICHSN